ncbi:MAG: hypothetical protein WAU84_24420, partial [Thermoguttaceae bacterium]
MKRPIPLRLPAAAHAAFTLVEIMVALALSLLLLAAVIGMFGRVSEGIGQSRSLLEMADRLRLTAQRLQMDLAGVTVTMNPPADPANSEGYFEYIEGAATANSNIAINSDTGGSDPTVGDYDDILMFTTRSSGKPFAGKYPLGPGGVGQSPVAEVAWFIRGHTLHRRVLLVLPGANLSRAPRNGFYTSYDISARWNGTSMVPNTLADLTQRENRFAHNPTCPPAGPSPCNWGQLGLPTLAECSSGSWTVGGPYPSLPAAKTHLDFWSNRTSTSNSDSYPWADTYFGTGSRLSDDIILTNVIGFDVKAWDPKASNGQGGQGMYVDLGYNTTLTGTNATNFSSLGDNKSSLMAANSNSARVYDTYSTSYFDPKGSNGIDDNGDGVVDDDNEKSPNGTALLPPYWYPLRGIQVKIRTFEPDSKQIREVTVV